MARARVGGFFMWGGFSIWDHEADELAGHFSPRPERDELRRDICAAVSQYLVKRAPNHAAMPDGSPVQDTARAHIIRVMEAAEKALPLADELDRLAAFAPGARDRETAHHLMVCADVPELEALAMQIRAIHAQARMQAEYLRGSRGRPNETARRVLVEELLDIWRKHGGQGAAVNKPWGKEGKPYSRFLDFAGTVFRLIREHEGIAPPTRDALVTDAQAAVKAMRKK